MAEAADLVLKKRDTHPRLKATLTEDGEPVDFATVLKVTVIIQPARGTKIEAPCTGPGGGSIKSATGENKGKVEYPWGQLDLNPTTTPETYKVEWEAEWPEEGGVKQLQTFPNGESPAPQYRTIEVIADLGGFGGA